MERKLVYIEEGTHRSSHLRVAVQSRNDRRCLERQSPQIPSLGFSSKRSTHPNPEAWHEPSLGNEELSLL